MRRLGFLVIPLMLCAGAAWAGSRGWTPEFRPFVGAYVPASGMHLGNSVLVGGQGAIEIASRLHVLGTFAWSPSEDSRLMFDNGVNVYQADGGLEVFQSMKLGSGSMLRPFLGAGAGGRTFDYRQAEGSKTYATTYGSLGTELQSGRLALRLEARSYVFRFRGLTGEENAKTRSDLAIVAGGAFHLW